MLNNWFKTETINKDSLRAIAIEAINDKIDTDKLNNLELSFWTKALEEVQNSDDPIDFMRQATRELVSLQRQSKRFKNMLNP